MAATVVPIVHKVLSQDNYEIWSLRVKTYLQAKDLWSVVKPTNEAPKLEDNEVEFKVWSNRNAEALHAIHICCGDDMFPFVSGLDTAKAAWDSLEAKFKSTISQTTAERPAGNAVCTGNEPTETPVPLMTIEDLRREFKSDPGIVSCNIKELTIEVFSIVVRDQSGNTDAELELILRVMQPLIPEYGFRNAFFIVLAKTGSLDGVKKIANLYPEVIKARSLWTGSTALHSAVYGEHVQVVKELVELMSEEDLELPGKGMTALIAAAQIGNVQMAKYMVEKNQRLVSLRCCLTNMLPVIFAAYGENWEMARYLYSLTPLEALTQEDNSRPGAQLISHCFYSQELDIALDLIRRCPTLAFAQDYNGDSTLYMLTSMRSLFLTGTRIGPWQKLIYNSIQIQPTTSPAVRDICINVESTEDGQANHRNLIIDSVMGWFRGLFTHLLQVLGVNHIKKKKLVHIQTLEILQFMSQVAKDLTLEEMQEGVVQKAILQAIERGNVEFISKMFDANLSLHLLSDGKGKRLLHYSIECRQEKVYCLLFGLMPRFAREQLVHEGDKFGNTILHSAGCLSSLAIAHLNQIQGAALQLQRELQWFKEVESIVPPKVHEILNHQDRMTARELFTKNHKEMLKDGERQMKEIATSSTVVGALIVTMMFASAFTFPGGTDGDTGMPVFLDKKQLFMVFIVSNSISLFASTTSIVIFLGILTSRYAEHDFLKSLPTKMVTALSTLFFSIATMMIAFVSALIIMLQGKTWIIILIVFLACIPITSFAWMQFPLLVEILISTFGRGVFHNKVELH